MFKKRIKTKYCPECGNKLILEEKKKQDPTFYCETCEKFIPTNDCLDR